VVRPASECVGEKQSAFRFLARNAASNTHGLIAGRSGGRLRT
jgi:hypothetical protein